MEEQAPQRPWEELEVLVEESDIEQIESFLETLPASETARAVTRLSDDDQDRLLNTISPESAAEVVEQIPEVHAVDLMERLEPEAAAAIVHELPSDMQADLLGEMQPEHAEAIFEVMPPEEAEEIRTLTQYDDDVAGGIMVTEFLTYPRTITVADVLEDLAVHADTYRHYHVQYIYVCDDANRLVGVLRLHDLILAPRQRAIETIMIPEPMTLTDTTKLDTIREVFEQMAFFGLPVVDETGMLVGVLQRSALEAALASRTENDYRASQGIIGGEELRTMPLLLRARRRLAWLSVNILLNIIAASVIAWYQDTLASVIALAVFLPIISDMSGCSGNQAVAVSIRELSLGLVHPREWLRVWGKEIAVGSINGLVLGILIALVAWVWQGNPFLGIVVGAAMTLNTLVSVSIGGAVPLLLRRLDLDPALASGPILTTITDMCGFFFVLSFATTLLAHLSS
ncbi:MAG: magnesium transporter [Candidatus Entotheonella factor]|uniref:Magnesium transporter MgtE n=2 Tax=Candidatus Entotheonella TaxID=93171 RepID=W4LUK8_ENTF1|nr:MAG: magnesium transporter [Candidatus Entotheonella factor]